MAAIILSFNVSIRVAYQNHGWYTERTLNNNNK